MLLALIIRGRKLLYISKYDPFALIRGRTKLEKWRYTYYLKIYIYIFSSHLQNAKPYVGKNKGQTN